MKFLPLLLIIFIPLFAHAQFSDPQFIHTDFPNSMTDVKEGDLNNDGLIDLVFAFNRHISWSKNIDGNGNWTTNQMIDPNHEELRSLAIADLNADGFLDIISVHDGQFEMFVKWYENDGTGNFSTAILIAEVEDEFSGSRSVSLVTDDSDNDGDEDVLVAFNMANDADSKIMLFENNGTGGFANNQVIASGIDTPEKIQLVNFNGDEFNDILIMSDRESILLIGNQDGTNFLDPVTLVVPPNSIINYKAGDIDGDGDDDIITVTRTTDKILWFENLANGTSFSQENTLVDGPSDITSIEMIDVDNDSDNDIIYIDSDAGHLEYLENTGMEGNFEEAIIISDNMGEGQTSILTFADVDLDNDLDLVAGGKDPDHYFIFSNIDGQGTYQEDQLLNMSAASQGSLMVRMAKMDDDNDKDVLIASRDYLKLSWLRYNSVLEVYEKPRLIETNATDFQEIIILSSHDFNNDGADDIMYALAGDDQFYFLVNDGAGNFTDGGSVFNPASDGAVPTFADLDNDGFEDLIIVNSFNFPGEGLQGLFWFRNLGVGNGFAAAEEIYTEEAVSRVEIVDFDNDGFLDLVPILESGSNLGWIKNNEGIFLPWEFVLSYNGTVNKAIIRDFNNDGFNDFVLSRTSGSVGSYFYESITATTFRNPYSLTPGFTISNLFSVDYDVDGLDDLLYTDEEGKLFWVKYKGGIATGGINLFEFEEEIDLGFEFIFDLQVLDLDADGDKDIIFKADGSTYSLINPAANGRIIANAFYDLNANGLAESNEPKLNHFQFSLLPDETVYFTTNDSSTTFFTDPGNFILTVHPLPDWQPTSGTLDYPIQLSADSIITENIGFVPTTITSSIDVDLTSAPTRCGFNVPFWLNYSNTGTSINSGMVDFHINENASLMTANPPADSIVGDTLYWFISDLPPTHNKRILLELEIPDAGFLGDTVDIISNTYLTDATGSEPELSQSFSFKSQITCAYDPNDKQVNPAGFLEEHYTLIGKDLEYTIRFQNTGNDTAFNVFIEDVLDPNLDLSSLQLLSASHPMETRINTDTRQIVFNFPNILLPDSLVNEPLSHGFVKFSVKVKDHILEGTRIENYAGIFFDANPPIITNTTYNTFVSGFPILVSEIITTPCTNEETGTIELNITAFPPVVIHWDDPSLVGSTLDSLPAGFYEVTIIDGIGDSLIQSYTIDIPDPLTGDFFVVPQDQNMLGTASVTPMGGTPPYEIIWNTNPIQNDTMAIDLVAGTYSVSITDANNCIFTDSIVIDFLTSATDIQPSMELLVFPNPASDIFFIQPSAGLHKKFLIQITDLAGNFILQEEKKSRNQLIKIELAALNMVSGVYFVKIVYDKKSVSKKLVVLEK